MDHQGKTGLPFTATREGCSGARLAACRPLIVPLFLTPRLGRSGEGEGRGRGVEDEGSAGI